jgi:hypothetical protein
MMKKIYEGRSSVFRDGNLDLFNQFLASTPLQKFEIAPYDSFGKKLKQSSYNFLSVYPAHYLRIYHIEPPGVVLIYESHQLNSNFPPKYTLTLVGRADDISDVEEIILRTAERIKRRIGEDE